MNVRVGALLLGTLVLLACPIGGLGLTPAATSTPVVPTPPPNVQPITRSINTALPDVRIGQSGSSCGLLAADVEKQNLSATLTIYPDQAQNQVQANTNDGQYKATAALLNGSCQPNGTQYTLTAAFGANYSAQLGKVGSATCIQQSQLVVTSFNLQGLPGPLNALAQGLITSQLPDRLKPELDQYVVQQLNRGSVPASGAYCQ